MKSELEELEKVAEQYQREGYQVIRNPKGVDLPAFLDGCEPDLIASGNGENAVVEVKAREELLGNQALVSMAAAVSAPTPLHPWRSAGRIGGPIG